MYVKNGKEARPDSGVTLGSSNKSCFNFSGAPEGVLCSGMFMIFHDCSHAEEYAESALSDT